MLTASARSVTEQALSCSRPRIRTRLGVASACIVTATAFAVGPSMWAGGGGFPWTP